MGITGILSIAGIVFRVLHEAPTLIKEVEDFWNAVRGKVEIPPHVDAAVQAAFVKLHEGEVG